MTTLRACAVAAVLAAPTTARAEIIPDFDLVVHSAALIVYCRAEMTDGGLRYRVVEVWKGDYRPDLFFDPPPDGYVGPLDLRWPGEQTPAAGNEVVLFYSGSGQASRRPQDRLGSSVSVYRVVKGHVGVATPGGGPSGGWQEFAFAHFRRRVLWSVAHQRTPELAAAAGAWVYAVLPPGESDPPDKHWFAFDSRWLELDPVNRPAVKPAPPPPSPAAAPWWAAGAVAGLAALGAYGRRGRR